MKGRRFEEKHRREKNLGRVGFKELVSLSETKEEELGGGDERISKRYEEKEENWE